MTAKQLPVLFIHGLWLHADSWSPWVDLFTQNGYGAFAAGWPGVPETVGEARANPESLAGQGIDDIVAHYTTIIDTLPARPIVIGHSFGGMIAQKLLGQDKAAAAIGIDAAQIKGVFQLPLSGLRSAWPVFKNPANKRRAVSLNADQFRFSFGNAVSREESDALHQKWTIPAPGRPLFEAAAANFSSRSPAKVATDNSERGPLLLVAGGEDHTVPKSIAKSTLKRYRRSSAITELIEIPGRGHSLTVDAGWREVAQTCLTWLARQGF
jgi:pimeloyl-ACP methyl ester carboxylesterase